MAMELWVEFFEELERVRGRSRNTVMAYRRDLELFDRYSGSHRASAKTNLPGFYDFMTRQGLSKRSQARVVSSLRTYFRFMEGRGHKVPEFTELRPPKIKVGLPKPVTPQEFDRLFAAAESDAPAKTLRNQMTLLLLYGLGCRVSELAAIDLSDFSETELSLRLMGKGGKERILPLTVSLAGELKKYILEARPHLVREPSPSLLMNDRGHRPSRVDVWRWLASWSAKAGFEEPLSPHRFRHGCATALLDAGADLRSIQILLGHASIQTTQIYTNVSARNLSETVRDHHPLSELKVGESAKAAMAAPLTREPRPAPSEREDKPLGSDPGSIRDPAPN